MSSARTARPQGQLSRSAATEQPGDATDDISKVHDTPPVFIERPRAATRVRRLRRLATFAVDLAAAVAATVLAPNR